MSDDRQLFPALYLHECNYYALPITAYKGMLCQTRILLSGFRYKEGGIKLCSIVQTILLAVFQ